MSKSGAAVLVCALELFLDGRRLRADDAPPPVPKLVQADNAASHAGETCIVAMEVQSSRLLADQQIVFLNSRRDYRDDDNFTVVIFEKTLQKFRDLGIEDPSKHFYKRTIHVTGGIELRRGKGQITLKEPDQIKIIKPGQEPREEVPPAGSSPADSSR